MRIDEETIDELVGEIVSWSSFHIIADDESQNLAKKLQDTLVEQNILANIISNAEEHDFEEGDCIFAISKTGNDKTVLYAVRIASSKNLKVFGLSNEKESELALLADEFIFIDLEDFDNGVSKVIYEIDCRLTEYLNDDDSEIMMSCINGIEYKERKVYEIKGTSWNGFYMISDGKSDELMKYIKKILYSNRTYFTSTYLRDIEEYENKFDDDDGLLLVSSSGEDKSLKYLYVEIPKKLNPYLVTNSEKSDLAFLSLESISISKNYEKDELDAMNDKLVKILKGDCKTREISFSEDSPAPKRKTSYAYIILAVLIIIVLLIFMIFQ